MAVMTVMDWSCDDFLGDGMDGGGGVQDLGLESVDWISDVVDCSVNTIGLEKAVASLYNTTVTGFMSILEISGVSVLDSVAVAVFRVSVIVHVFHNWSNISVMSISTMMTSMSSMMSAITTTKILGRCGHSKSQNGDQNARFHC